ncbi:DUF3618 domain-containing protein [Kitasatospora sp. A2-31]|uniref:DUF3618 domain-containing protein n=1 Tax=Kitasatospora sp. A2-31 TaxID=2916414 RepID=UPI001EEAE398|nr:DUF3618 domain-containing protein [Kitasatospora sp. A2-31]MCG6494312.1 DUF3618 domain-containing protein [Kitasatospora sp. A2-31]
MGSTPDQLREQIETRRAHLAHNVDRLADRITPSKVAHRKVDAAQRRLTGMKERVMGTAHDTADTTRGVAGSVTDTAAQLVDTAKDTATRVGSTAKDTATDIGDTVQQAPAQIRRQTQGSPLAAGIIAFGAGLLAAALLPSSRVEAQAGTTLREHADEVLESAKQTAVSAAQDMRDELREPAAQALDAVKSTAQDAAQAGKEAAQDAGRQTARDLKDTGQEAVQDVRRP